MSGSEPFPLLNTANDQLHQRRHAPNPNSSVSNTTATEAAINDARRRRKSSALGGDIRGDTGAPALASSRASLDATDKNAHSAGHKRLSKRRRARGLLARARQAMIKHTFVLPAVLLLFFLAGYIVNPTESNPIHRFIFLSYKLPQEDPSEPAQYDKGLWDIAFVSFYTIVLSFTREFIMQELLAPLARWYKLSRGKKARFMEQVYTAIYFGILGPFGLWVMSHTPVWYFNTRGMYEGFPHRTLLGPVKFYYLFEAAYWAQQAIVLVLGMEKPRKDFKELVGHHIVTLGLIGLSYRFHFTYIGLAVYVTHDISDFFLATSKTLNYIDSPLVAPYFGLFMIAWIYLRHFLNLKIIWSLLTEFETIGPFELNWETQQYKCRLSQVITTTLLSALQALNLFWLFCIARIAWRFVSSNELGDDRSEDEDEGEEEGEDEDVPAPAPIKANGQANGSANGHANGHANGKIVQNGEAKN
ncbi:acyl- -dependent ceramide synthase [Fusarium albosuccineum]|uniref:Acyl- -dependent ceramide synthase n=1 Tax=Fusarium albosuccineum TaxID=1237068 RepID=A0A8H4NW98_9HYPO|nr:acyl- -dependent ceramide synthase [Fusarium albosuccineum]